MKAIKMFKTFLKLKKCHRHYLVIRDELLLDDLHRVDPLGGLELDHQDLCVAAAADHANQLEVVQRDHAHVVVSVWRKVVTS